MSFQSAVSKLNSPVKDLVLAVTRDGTELIGEFDKDQAEVASWIEKTSQGDLVAEGNLKDLNTLLVPRTYIATNYLTAADVALYGALHPIVSRLSPTEHYTHPSVTRYFDHIQYSSPVRTSADSLGSIFSPVVLNIENAPRPERKVEPKKKEKKPAAAAHTTEAEPAETEATPAAATGGAPIEKTQKKEKKEKKKDAGEEGGKKKAGGKAAPAADEGDPVPSMIDLRVGHIVDIMKHPDADGLYVEQIDIGEETGPRTVVSGLVNYIPIDQMRDKYLVAVCNLKPANMRGVKSFAMVLCATAKEGKDGGIELIQPPADSKPGDRVYFEGADFENATPLAQLNPKKKIFEAIQPGFITLDSREAAWINPTTRSVHKIRTKEGVCVAPTLVGASLS
ncbi:hypothetical protein BDQ12DRAFT_601097 [Crucibulum laeve]|uniref:tRNA-binding domain-containing protein n=1 Tax=Crucibulum laeve TaxID=68775 RepID=A0A5C3M7K5_9AGAR|nr:hypothetical protein BDQ12DRAFT_601097 [Crucibulum laeve]